MSNPPPAERHDTPVKHVKKGKEEFAEDVQGGGNVVAESGVKVYGAGGDPYPDASSLSYNGDDAEVVSHAHFTTYLVRGVDIVHATEIDLRWELVGSRIAPMQPPVIKASGARSPESAQRRRLAEQFPSNSLDYRP